MTVDAGAAPRSAAHWSIVPFTMIGVAVCSTPIAILSLSVFFIPLGDALGWGRGDVTAAIAVMALAMAFSTPVAGRLIDRLGVRPVLITSLALYGIVLALTPLFIAQFGLIGFYAAYALIGVVSSGSNTVAYTHVLSGWFDKTRGLVLGFAMCGVAIGGIVGPALATYLIATYGWQTGFYGLAALPLLIGVPNALFAIREAPRLAQAHAQHGEVAGMNAAAAFKTRSFWTLFTVFLIVATFQHGTQLHVPSLMEDRGLSPQQAVGVFSLLFVVTAFMRIGAGFLFDRFFAPVVGAVLFLCGAVGITMLAPHWAPFYYMAGAALIGIGTGGETDLLGYVTSRYYGMKAFGQIYGGLFFAFMLGSAIGPYAMGYAFDKLGSYDMPLLVCATGMAIAALLLLTLPKFPKLEAAAP